jgi:phage FluMu protein Com
MTSIVVWKTCSNKKCGYVWMSSIEEKCPMCGRLNQRILDIEAELRKQSREKIKKASMFL